MGDFCNYETLEETKITKFAVPVVGFLGLSSDVYETSLIFCSLSV